jgi:hypothetical protein
MLRYIDPKLIQGGIVMPDRDGNQNAAEAKKKSDTDKSKDQEKNVPNPSGRIVSGVTSMRKRQTQERETKKETSD